MYVQPLTTPTIQPVAQAQLNPWELQLEAPGPIQGLAGLGLGCVECGGTCGGANKGMGNMENFPWGVLVLVGLAVWIMAAGNGKGRR